MPAELTAHRLTDLSACRIDGIKKAVGMLEELAVD
jgi:hypothetical protein